MRSACKPKYKEAPVLWPHWGAVVQSRGHCQHIVSLQVMGFSVTIFLSEVPPLYSSMYFPCTQLTFRQLEDWEEEPRGISQHET